MGSNFEGTCSKRFRHIDARTASCRCAVCMHTHWGWATLDGTIGFILLVV